MPIHCWVSEKLTLQDFTERSLRTANNPAELETSLTSLENRLTLARKELAKPEMAKLLSLYKKATDQVRCRHRGIWLTLL